MFKFSVGNDLRADTPDNLEEHVNFSGTSEPRDISAANDAYRIGHSHAPRGPAPCY